MGGAAIKLTTSQKSPGESSSGDWIGLGVPETGPYRAVVDMLTTLAAR